MNELPVNSLLGDELELLPDMPELPDVDESAGLTLVNGSEDGPASGLTAPIGDISCSFPHLSNKAMRGRLTSRNYLSKSQLRLAARVC